jgi:hypothetical protein
MTNTRFPDAPARIKALRVSALGFPVPWFVYQTPDEEPDLRIADERKWVQAVNHRKCWVCGQNLGRHLVFPIGPMCAVNRVTSDPPCHLECAEFSVKACPFLSRPTMKRSPREKAAGNVAAPGLMIERNPGVACLWTCEDYKTFRPHGGNPGLLIRLGRPTAVSWWREGRAATRAEVEESIGTGLPLLREAAVLQAGGVEELERQTLIVTKYLPKEEDRSHDQHHHAAPA